MKSNSLLLISLLTLSMIFLMGCDGSTGGGSKSAVPTPSPGFSPEPDILPYDPPLEGGPDADLDNGGNDGSDPGDPGGDGGSGGQDPVPEPSTLLLVGSGITLITLCNRRKKNKEAK